MNIFSRPTLVLSGAFMLAVLLVGINAQSSRQLASVGDVAMPTQNQIIIIGLSHTNAGGVVVDYRAVTGGILSNDPAYVDKYDARLLDKNGTILTHRTFDVDHEQELELFGSEGPKHEKRTFNKVSFTLGFPLNKTAMKLSVYDQKQKRIVFEDDISSLFAVLPEEETPPPPVTLPPPTQPATSIPASIFTVLWDRERVTIGTPVSLEIALGNGDGGEKVLKYLIFPGGDASCTYAKEGVRVSGSNRFNLYSTTISVPTVGMESGFICAQVSLADDKWVKSSKALLLTIPVLTPPSIQLGVVNTSPAPLKLRLGETGTITIPLIWRTNPINPAGERIKATFNDRLITVSPSEISFVGQTEVSFSVRLLTKNSTVGFQILGASGKQIGSGRSVSVLSGEPDRFSATQSGSQEARLSWSVTPLNGEKLTYDIYRSPLWSKAPSTVPIVRGLEVGSYVDNPRADTYTYRLVARDPQGKSVREMTVEIMIKK